ncbi:MAG: helix-turn-helix transcriptional regulator [Veillonella sp.]|uniref:helix-turn-helix domain-containing protein n=1 Tax=Veillonella sp. TaxID=1926307 RepID=UPI0025FF5E28|nr:helix-turn-helix transcriptional regulator [Veillonella sp.]MBE6079405.1 helix-turn-helix transcriptional regulator [Veillonella sp.]
MNSFSKKLKETMLNRGITQSDLSTMTSIRASSISDWLNDKYSPKQDKIAIIAKALNVSPAWLMGYDDISNEESKGYYEDPEVAQLANEIKNDPELRLLLDAKRSLSKEDMESVINITKSLLRKERGFED